MIHEACISDANVKLKVSKKQKLVRVVTAVLTEGRTAPAEAAVSSKYGNISK